MKKEKILINIEDLSDINNYKKIGINNFLFAVDYFSIGYKSFKLSEIKNIEGNKFLYINRILNSTDVDKLKELADEICIFDGIIFEDIAVYNIFKDKDILLIWNQSHFATNYSSINYWLNNVDSAIISNELTKLEINEILDKCNKNLVLNIFGKNPVMYSRRRLISNFNNNFNLYNDKNVILKEPITKNEFNAVEDDNGTFIFNNTYFNLIPYLNEFNNDKILYYLICANDLSFSEMVKYLNGKIDNTNDGFLNKKTIYKLGVKK